MASHGVVSASTQLAFHFATGVTQTAEFQRCIANAKKLVFQCQQVDERLSAISITAPSAHAQERNQQAHRDSFRRPMADIQLDRSSAAKAAGNQ
jgi:hypothetical protein